MFLFFGQVNLSCFKNYERLYFYFIILFIDFHVPLTSYMRNRVHTISVCVSMCFVNPSPSRSNKSEACSCVWHPEHIQRFQSPWQPYLQKNTHRTQASVWPEWGLEQRLALPPRKTPGLISTLLTAVNTHLKLSLWTATEPWNKARISTQDVCYLIRPAASLPASPVSEDLDNTCRSSFRWETLY